MTQKVLITGFGPFPRVPVNASGALVGRLAVAARRRFPGAVISSAVLPTEWWRGPRRAESALLRARPDVAIHFGVSSRAEGFVIERRALNVCESSPDGAGELPLAELLDPGGPKQRGSTLPVGAIVKRLWALGLPATPSDDAGTYLCNAVLYTSLGLAAGSGRMTGFVHIPAVLAGGGASPLNARQALTGGLEIIGVCLAHVGAELAAVHR